MIICRKKEVITVRDTTESEKIYYRVDKLRIEKGWSSYALAQKADISVNALYRWKNKKSSPSLYLLERIADALNVSLASLIFDVEKTEVLTGEQRLVVERWNTLNNKQRATLFDLMELFNDK